jgi:hypothetical protein
LKTRIAGWPHHRAREADGWARHLAPLLRGLQFGANPRLGQEHNQLALVLRMKGSLYFPRVQREHLGMVAQLGDRLDVTSVVQVAYGPVANGKNVLIPDSRRESL